MTLFDNLIAAKHYKNGAREYGTFFTMHGWNTVTTRERLKAIGVHIRQRNGEAQLYRPQDDTWQMMNIDTIYYLSPDKKEIKVPTAAEIPEEYHNAFWR